ncbi:MAG: hypothetical protein Tsb0020_45540 [Haliangiales bacterium]
MERFYVVAPALIPSAYMIGAFLYYCALSAAGRRPQVDGVSRRKFTDIFGPFLIGYLFWLLRPIERLFVASRVPPNAITMTSMMLCAIAGVAAATGYLATAAWVYIGAGMFDVLDGRLARATNRSSKSGAFLDSVSDRWGELLIFSGYAWLMRDSPWLLAVMLAVAGSMMVSYTRARGEGLGVDLDGGTMQRAERIAIVAIGTLAAAWLQAATNTAGYALHVIGVALLITGVGSVATGLGRWVHGYRALTARERARADDEASASQPLFTAATRDPKPSVEEPPAGDQVVDSTADNVDSAALLSTQSKPRSRDMASAGR